MKKRPNHVCLPFWQRLILVNALIISYTLIIIIHAQYIYACNGGNGGNGGTSTAGVNGSAGGIGGDCVIGGYKSVNSGGIIQNNGNSSNNNANLNG